MTTMGQGEAQVPSRKEGQDHDKYLFPIDLEIDKIPPELKKEGSDWFVAFNSTMQRVLDIKLAHVFMHERCVVF
jgi:hypothetical protein